MLSGNYGAPTGLVSDFIGAVGVRRRRSRPQEATDAGAGKQVNCERLVFHSCMFLSVTVIWYTKF
mgnify:CR=1 FL=1